MNILVFDVEISGHHIEYLNHLITYIIKYDETNNKYFFIVHPEFKINEKFKNIINEKIVIIPILEIEYDHLFYYKSNIPYLLHNPKSFYKLLIKYSEKFKVKKSIILTLNTFLKPLIINRTNFDIYGILFAPPTRRRKNKYEELKKLLLTFLFTRNSKLKKIFILNDNKVVEILNKQNRTNIFTCLPDPVINLSIENDNIDIRKKYNIEKKKKIFLHFGSLRRAKGTVELIQSLKLLPENILNNICVIIAGKSRADIKELIEKLIYSINNIQVVYLNNFIDDSEMVALFNQSDIIVMPYKNSEASSGVLGHAISANKPVISSAQGLLGELIQKYWVGELLDEITPEKIALAIQKSLISEYVLKDNEIFLKEHSPYNFAKIIFNSINL